MLSLMVLVAVFSQAGIGYCQCFGDVVFHESSSCCSAADQGCEQASSCCEGESEGGCDDCMVELELDVDELVVGNGVYEFSCDVSEIDHLHWWDSVSDFDLHREGRRSFAGRGSLGMACSVFEVLPHRVLAGVYRL